ncbi:MaoC-like domain-containing protein [Pseudomonas coronafaciens pv. garcae]|uniref:MaoC-like domain-containing protein n=2 Tax=Pseudomonas syringae group TaxID=136849 RepID=A0AB37QJC0_9PSED|nr:MULTISPECIES: MaoC/PaaZ C-terminal domain-containing protein [Pseudomonas syringae group]KGS14511.1 acyl dehydratase [Pseudomonas coronafaciens]RMR96560.1 MaoC-like domain-containing protein [Pseudomonas coronafaciens pv. garcae]RMS08067.1 MaoC-like domain-containing protein [Pseudomonas coronafaciens pv. garcae]RMS32598.1 MaoC-like domain-containing protein [Pseudomonas coronafaciens pv. garcae]RMV07487.1 MaoC-like domain-containing protein [Pseudomonas coronafaciens pv. coronafaciens]
MTAHWRYLDSLQPLSNLFLQAAMRRRKVTGSQLPDLGLRSWVAVDATKVGAYRKVCGFEDSSLLPPTYPHVMAFQLQMQLMTSQEFPFPLLGLIHIDNCIRIHRPLGGVSQLYISVQATNLRPHRKGAMFTLVTQAEDGLGLLWEEESTMLCTAAESDSSSAEPEESVQLPLMQVESWRAPPQIGRDYAKVSGDYNPIHLSAPSAKMFGFPRAIAHGMWLKARALAALDEHLPTSNIEISAQFKKSVRLPAYVMLSASAGSSQGQFRVDDDNDIVHMTGSWQPVTR